MLFVTRSRADSTRKSAYSTLSNRVGSDPIPLNINRHPRFTFQFRFFFPSMNINKRESWRQKRRSEAWNVDSCLHRTRRYHGTLPRGSNKLFASFVHLQRFLLRRIVTIVPIHHVTSQLNVISQASKDSRWEKASFEEEQG